MPLKIVVDEDLPKSLTSFLRKQGLMVWDVRECGLRGASDSEVLAFAVSKKALVITGDLGFIKDFSRKHYGIMIIRIPRKLSLPEQIRLIWSCLRSIEDIKLSNQIIICEPGRVRIKR